MTSQITVSEMKNAEAEIVRHVQTECFSEEIASLKTQSTDTTNDNTARQQAQRWMKSTKRASPIHRLDPQLKNGILHVGGRLRNSSISHRAKHPVILPKTHYISDLIIRYYHAMSVNSRVG